MMELQERIDAFEKLGLFLSETGMEKYTLLGSEQEILKRLLPQVQAHNAWFTPSGINAAIGGIAKSLTRENLEKWIVRYKADWSKQGKNKQVAVIMAGNIPAVGFHDFVAVLLAGHKFIGKVSSDDNLLIPFFAAVLLQIEPRFKTNIEFTDGTVKAMDAVIATGSNNTSRYFDYYFGKYPHIIRKNRHSVALINGQETKEDWAMLGNDIFQYYGLGCRNVSKLLVPEGYKFDSFFEGIFSFSGVLDHNKYVNNYEYNKTVYLMHGEKLLDNNFLLLREDQHLSSPIGVLFYEYYKDEQHLREIIERDEKEIQCLVSRKGAVNGSLPFGESQCPMLWDYADGVDTMKFLLSL
ncbi:MAG: acyl-CoA reductase [Bacteroidia bacterium]